MLRSVLKWRKIFWGSVVVSQSSPTPCYTVNFKSRVLSVFLSSSDASTHFHFETPSLCVLNFGWPFKKGKDNRKILIGTTSEWPWQLNRSGRLIGVYLRYFTENIFGTLITGQWIRGGCLIEIWLYFVNQCFLFFLILNYLFDKWIMRNSNCTVWGVKKRGKALFQNTALNLMLEVFIPHCTSLTKWITL